MRTFQGPARVNKIKGGVKVNNKMFKLKRQKKEVM